MAAADNDVRVALRKLLPTVDMDTTSERKASHQLASGTGAATSAVAGWKSSVCCVTGFTKEASHQVWITDGVAVAAAVMLCRSVECLLTSWAQTWSLTRS
jgi:hypothetical protein